MPTNFPSGLDNFTNPTAADNLNSVTVPHADQHANENDAIEALEAKVGIDGSLITGSLDYRVRSLETGTHSPVTLGTANGLTLSGQQMSMGLAGANATGTLSAADWNTFNNKISSATGTAVAVVGTLADVMLLTPTAGRIAYATTASASDTRTINKFMVADGTNWREVELPMPARTGLDMGLEADSGQQGYGVDYISDKTLHSVAIKGHPKTPVNGSVRLNIDSTPDTFEIYMRDTGWFTILYDFTIANNDLRHTPVSEQIYVWRGDSVSVGVNGRPIVSEYSVSMGANPPPRVLNGGTF